MANYAHEGGENTLSGLDTRDSGTTNPFQLVYERTGRAQPFNLAPQQNPTSNVTTGQVWPRGRN